MTDQGRSSASDKPATSTGNQQPAKRRFQFGKESSPKIVPFEYEPQPSPRTSEVPKMHFPRRIRPMPKSRTGAANSADLAPVFDQAAIRRHADNPVPSSSTALESSDAPGSSNAKDIYEEYEEWFHGVFGGDDQAPVEQNATNPTASSAIGSNTVAAPVLSDQTAEEFLASLFAQADQAIIERDATVIEAKTAATERDAAATEQGATNPSSSSSAGLPAVTAPAIIEPTSGEFLVGNFHNGWDEPPIEPDAGNPEYDWSVILNAAVTPDSGGQTFEELFNETFYPPGWDQAPTEPDAANPLPSSSANLDTTAAPVSANATFKPCDTEADSVPGFLEKGDIERLTANNPSKLSADVHTAAAPTSAQATSEPLDVEMEKFDDLVDESAIGRDAPTPLPSSSTNVYAAASAVAADATSEPMDVDMERFDDLMDEDAMEHDAPNPLSRPSTGVYAGAEAVSADATSEPLDVEMENVDTLIGKAMVERDTAKGFAEPLSNLFTGLPPPPPVSSQAIATIPPGSIQQAFQLSDEVVRQMEAQKKALVEEHGQQLQVLMQENQKQQQAFEEEKKEYQQAFKQQQAFIEQNSKQQQALIEDNAEQQQALKGEIAKQQHDLEDNAKRQQALEEASKKQQQAFKAESAKQQHKLEENAKRQHALKAENLKKQHELDEHAKQQHALEENAKRQQAREEETAKQEKYIHQIRKEVEGERDSLRGEVEKRNTLHSQELRENEARYKRGMDEMERHASDIQTTFDKLRKELDEQFRTTNQQKRAIAERDLTIKKAEADISNGKNELLVQGRKLTVLKGLYDKVLRDIQTEMTEAKTAEAQLKECQTMLKEEQTARKKTETQMKDLEKKHDDLKSTEPHKLVDSLRNDLALAKSEAKNLGLHVESLRRQVRKISVKEADALKEVAKLKVGMEESEQDFEELEIELAKYHKIMRLQSVDLAIYRDQATITESLRSTWRKAYGEEVNPEDPRDEQVPISGPDLDSNIEAHPPSPIGSGEPSPALGGTGGAGGTSGTTVASSGGPGERAEFHAEGLPSPAFLREKWLKDQRDVEHLLDISPLRAKGIVHGLRRIPNCQHNHPLRLATIASEVLQIPRKLIKTLQESVEGVDYEQDDASQNIAAGFLYMKPKQVEAMMQSQQTRKASQGTQTEDVGSTTSNGTQTDDPTVKIPADPLSLSGIQELSVKPAIIATEPPLETHATGNSPFRYALWIMALIFLLAVVGLAFGALPGGWVVEDPWTVSVLSTRVGEGCGTSVPEWLWEDPFLELSGSLFG